MILVKIRMFTRIRIALPLILWQLGTRRKCRAVSEASQFILERCWDG